MRVRHLLEDGLERAVVTAVMPDFIQHRARQQVVSRDTRIGPRHVLPAVPVSGLCIGGKEQHLAARHQFDGEYEAAVVRVSIEPERRPGGLIEPIVVHQSPLRIRRAVSRNQRHQVGRRRHAVRPRSDRRATGLLGPLIRFAEWILSLVLRGAAAMALQCVQESRAERQGAREFRVVALALPRIVALK